MNTQTEAEKLFAELADKIKREAYAQGWRDAFSQLEVALAEYKEVPEIKEKLTLSGNQAPKTLNKISGGRMPKQGTTPHAILTAVTANPGMKAGQIVDAVRDSGHTAPIPSIQTNIQRLKQRKLIVLRHGKWYPE
jgi:hypothetical protein